MSTATSLIRVVTAAAAQQGVDASPILAKTGLSQEVVQDRNARVSTAAFLEFFAATSARCAPGSLGPASAKLLDPAAFGLLGFVVASCPTLGEALGRFCRYSRLLCDELKIDLATLKNEVSIVYAIEVAPHVPALFEMAFAHLIATARRGTRGLFRPSRVVFRHGSGSRALLEQLQAPVEFGGVQDAVCFAPGELDLPLRGANPALLGILESHAAMVLSSLPAEDDMIARVRLAIRALLPLGDLSLEAVAARTGVGARTLQRRLREQKLTFRNLVDDIRRECALAQLAQPEVSVAEVAFSLGFSDPSAFHHAFRRWTGRNPGRR